MVLAVRDSDVLDFRWLLAVLPSHVRLRRVEFSAFDDCRDVFEIVVYVSRDSIRSRLSQSAEKKIGLRSFPTREIRAFFFETTEPVNDQAHSDAIWSPHP